MKILLLNFFAILISYATYAQNGADYNYTVGVKAFNLTQLPKILNQTNIQDYTSSYLNGLMFKFNDNQISYRISGNYYKGDKQFDNTCETCETGNGKITDYSFKIGFEKNFNFERIQPYFGFDLGYRANRFSGNITPKTIATGSNSQTAYASKNGVVLTPLLGVKFNIIPQLSVFAESNLDFYYSYEKQDITGPNGIGRTVNTYNKWEFLLNPITAGLQFNISPKN